ncbi:MAG: TatD family hydrolase [Patescibacteria group bacterium UBA2163]
MNDVLRYIDVHCHPNLDGLKEDQDAVIARMREGGVAGIVVGVDLESSREAVRLAQKHDNLWACVGLHPNYTQKEVFDRDAFAALLNEPRVVGVGECGLDFFRQSTTAPGEESGEGWKETQWEVFKAQTALAQEYDMPLMVHCRPSKGSMDAYEEAADYFESLGNGQHPGVDQEGEVDMAGANSADVRRPHIGVVKGNMHFFVGNLAVARRFWALGMTTSFTGVLTFTEDYDEVVREAPLDMLLTETDAPYAAPKPHRGERNEPAYVQHVVGALARIRGISEEEVQSAVRENAQRVFGVVSLLN